MELIAGLLLPLIFSALPTGLSIKARRYEQAAIVLLICLSAPFFVAAVAAGFVESQYTDPMGRSLDEAFKTWMWFAATAVVVPLFCSSVLWELGKFKTKPN